MTSHTPQWVHQYDQALAQRTQHLDQLINTMRNSIERNPDDQEVTIVNTAWGITDHITPAETAELLTLAIARLTADPITRASDPTGDPPTPNPHPAIP